MAVLNSNRSVEKQLKGVGNSRAFLRADELEFCCLSLVMAHPEADCTT